MKLIFAPVWGRLSDQYVRRPVILIGLVGNAGALVLFGAAQSLLIRPTNASWISKQTKFGQGATIGVMDAFLSLGRVLGPLFAGRLYTPETFQISCWLAAVSLVVASVCLFYQLRRIGQRAEF